MGGFNLGNLMSSIGSGLSGIGQGQGPQPGQGPAPGPMGQDPSMINNILGILANGALGAGGQKPKFKTVFKKSIKNVRPNASLNATGNAPGFDSTGASIPGMAAGLPGAPAALSSGPPGSGDSDNDSD